MRLTSLLRLVDNLQQASKIHNLQQFCGVNFYISVSDSNKCRGLIHGGGGCLLSFSRCPNYKFLKLPAKGTSTTFLRLPGEGTSVK